MIYNNILEARRIPIGELFFIFSIFIWTKKIFFNKIFSQIYTIFKYKYIFLIFILCLKTFYIKRDIYTSIIINAEY